MSKTELVTELEAKAQECREKRETAHHALHVEQDLNRANQLKRERAGIIADL